MYLWEVKVRTTNSTNNRYVDAKGSYRKCIDGIFYTACDKMSEIEAMVSPGDLLSVTYKGFYLAA